MKKRVTKSYEILRESSRHLFYEFTMLIGSSSQALILASSLQPGNVIGNALVESFALHTRNLIEFLYAGIPNEDDVITEDFIQNWDSVGPKITENLASVKKRVHKEVAHLTYTRIGISLVDKIWQTQDIITEIEEVFKEFLINCSENLICEQLIKLKKEYVTSK